MRSGAAAVFLHGLAFLLLSVLTQLGGLAYLIAYWFGRGRAGKAAIFAASYFALMASAMLAAPAFGRTSLPCFGDGSLRMQSPLYCALNRQYVTPDMAQFAHTAADAVARRHPGTVTLSLDANFPLFDGFPLLPHLSHNDGEKLDFALYYSDESGNYLPAITRSPIGYWAFETPSANAPHPCQGRKDRATLRWDMRWFAPLTRPLTLDRTRTAALLNWVAQNPPPGYRVKLLIEPHLKQSLGIVSDKVRFQGCRAARHDDHIHIQISRS